MQVTVDSSDSLDNALRVMGALYGVELTVRSGNGAAPEAAAADGDGRKEQPAPSRRRSRSTGSRSRRSGGGRSGSPDLAAVRAWAREQGYDVSDRGRVPNSILAAYQDSVASA